MVIAGATNLTAMVAYVGTLTYINCCKLLSEAYSFQK